MHHNHRHVSLISLLITTNIMKTETRTLYELDELDAKARERAIDRERTSRYECGDPWQSEQRATLDAFCKAFPVKWKEWNDYGIDYRITLDDREQVEVLTGARLLAYVWNHHRIDVYKGKYYSTPMCKCEKSPEHPAGLTYTHRHSRIQLEGLGACVLTGVSYDESILGPVYDILDGKHIHDTYTYIDMLDDCMHAFHKDVTSEYEYFTSDEAITEDLRDNLAYFTEQGERV